MDQLPRRHSKPGPLIDYLLNLYQADRINPGNGLKEAATRAIEAVKAVAATENGAIMLDLLEKSTQEYFLPPDASERALDALNAQRFIALDLRRIVSNEIQTEMDRDSAQPRRRGKPVE